MGDTGLTAFLVALMAAPRDRLARADPAKLAAKYKINPAWAAWYLDEWRKR